jgi:large subunit ribosomal protein L6
MSRVGKKPVAVLDKVQVTVQGQQVKVKGPKGELSFSVHPKIKVEMKDKEVVVTRSSDQPLDRALHGTTRSVIRNMVQGVSEGYVKELEIVGVGAKAAIKGKTLSMSLGFTHPIDYQIRDGVDIKCPNPTRIVISGANKQLVGQSAAEIRSFNPPEPYKGKGIRYVDEQVRRKQGKKVGS